MSRVYEAVTKAEFERNGGPYIPVEEVPVNGREGPHWHWDSEGPSPLEYQRIRVWLTSSTARQRIQTVMVAGPWSGTGSTTTAALLAASLAEAKKTRVLIIDGNFRTPALNMVFQIKNGSGLTEVVSEGVLSEARIQPTNRPNLFALTCGQLPICPPEVYEGGGIEELISELKQKFDFIIFDSSPLIEFPESYALAPKVDGIIMVVEADKTSVEDARRAKRNLEYAGGRILGVVLNRQKDYTPAFLKKFFSHAY
jgi:capsular exopolysaccharide synthesis family protein